MCFVCKSCYYFLLICDCISWPGIKYITIAALLPFQSLQKLGEQLLLYFIGFFVSMRCSLRRGPWHLLDQANEIPVKCKHMHTPIHEENLILSNTKVKLIDSILYPDPQNGHLYHAPMQTFSPFTKRTESCAMCRLLFRG